MIVKFKLTSENYGNKNNKRYYGSHKYEESEKDEKFEKNLAIYIDRWTAHSTKNSFINQSVYVIAQALYEKHNCDAYFITLTMPQTDILIKQWNTLDTILTQLIKELNEQFLIAGAVISIEIHKNTSKASHRGKNSKSGYPHIHMVIWTYHNFLNPTINDLRIFFIRKKFDTNVKELKKTVDVKKAILYTIKESADFELRQICHQALNRPYSAFVWSNHSECQPLLQELTQQLTSTRKQYQIGFENTSQNIIPTVKRIENQKLMLATLFAKIFELRKWAVFDDYVYRPIEGAHYTWQRWLTLENLISSCYQQYLPPQFLTMLANSAHWIAVQGAIHKNAPKMQIFPQLIIENQFVEFFDGIYDFTHGKFIKEHLFLSPFTSCTNFHPTNFDQLEPPLHILGFIFTLLASTNEDPILRKIFQPQKTPEKTPTPFQQKKQQEEQKTCEKWEHEKLKQLTELIILIGGIFHPEVHRKANPALLLIGEPSSYKTFFLMNLLRQTFGEHQIKVISRTGGRFTFGFLTRNNKVTIFMDDVQWNQLGITAGEFINLLDRNPIAAEQKYEKGTQVCHEGALLLTANSPINTYTTFLPDLGMMDNGLSRPQQLALEKRIKTIRLQVQKDLIYIPDEPQLSFIKEQCINLSILANAVYLKSKTQGRLPHGWTHQKFDPKEYDSSENLFQRLGAKIFHYFINNL